MREARDTVPSDAFPRSTRVWRWCLGFILGLAPGMLGVLYVWGEHFRQLFIPLFFGLGFVMGVYIGMCTMARDWADEHGDL